MRPGRVRNLEPDLIGALYDRLGASLYRYALMILADPSAAADAVQQVFLALLRGGAAVDSCDRYLRRAIRNECYSVLRRLRRREASSLDEGVNDLFVASHGSEDRIDERLAIDEAMRRLPAEQREAVYLKVFEGMTFQEIAAEIGESANTVASRYRYAVGKLRDRLLAPASRETRR